MFWENSNTWPPSLEVTVGADNAEAAFLYLSVEGEDGEDIAEMILTNAADVDAFEQEVTAACAAFRRARLAEAGGAKVSKKTRRSSA